MMTRLMEVNEVDEVEVDGSDEIRGELEVDGDAETGRGVSGSWRAMWMGRSWNVVEVCCQGFQGNDDQAASCLHQTFKASN